MNILIIGDSWGVPQYNAELRPQALFEYHMIDRSYQTYNASMSGASNLEAIDRGFKLLKGYSILHPSSFINKKINKRVSTNPDIQLTHIPKIDWIIWFHTDFGRDWRDFRAIPVGATFIDIAEKTYRKFFELKEFAKAKAIIVGGTCPIFPTVSNYGTAELILPDWRGDLLSKDPVMKAKLDLRRAKIAQEVAPDNVDKQYEELINNPDIPKFMELSECFPDNSHPSNQVYREFAAQLDQFILEYEKKGGEYASSIFSQRYSLRPRWSM